MNKIEQMISEIEEYIDNCKFQSFSSTKIVVHKDELEELLAELRMSTPDEIKKYQKIVANTDAILEDANRKADEIIARANQMTEELISEHEIMQQAYSQANEIIDNATVQAKEILDNATMDANEIRMGAIAYTDTILHDIEKILSYSMENFDSRYNSLRKSLADSLDIVVANRNELLPQEAEPVQGNETNQEEINVEEPSEPEEYN